MKIVVDPPAQELETQDKGHTAEPMEGSSLLKWSRNDQGGWTTNDGVFRISSSGTTFWLHEGRSRRWIASCPRECAQMAEHIEAHARAVMSLASSFPTAEIKRETHIPGIHVTNIPEEGHFLDRVTSRNGMRGPYITLRDENDEAVGHLPTIFTDSLPTYVIGEMTINSSAWITPELTGKGLGTLMYDLAEEITGLRMVPHSKNFVSGRLSDAAQRFWARRAATRGVPGLNDAEAAKRREIAQEVMDYLDLEGKYHRDALFAAAVSRRTGWPLEVVYVQGWGKDGEPTDSRYPREAWCIAPDGRAFTSLGYQDRDKLIARTSDSALISVEAEKVISDMAQKFADDYDRESEEAKKYLPLKNLEHELMEATHAADQVLERHAVPVRDRALDMDEQANPSPRMRK